MGSGNSAAGSGPMICYSRGPWMIERFSSADTEPGEGAMTAIVCLADDDGKDGAILAKVNRWAYGDDPAKPESDANARLISAAPDMIEWIRAVLRAPERFTDAELDAAEEIIITVGG